MHPRRWIAAVALALAALVAFATVTHAATVAGLDIKLSSSKAGKSKKPRGVRLNFSLTLDTDDGTSPPTTKETTVLFSRGIRFNASKFRSCTLATLNSKGPSACPKGAKVGTGSAVALVGGSPGSPKPTTTESLKVTAYNGPRGRSYLLWLDGESPANIKQAIEGKLQRATSPYGYKLVVTIPANLQQPLPGLYAPLVSFKVKTGATRTVSKRVRKGHRRVTRKVRVNYIETTACPKSSSGRAWPFEAELSFANAPAPVTATSEQSCR